MAIEDYFTHELTIQSSAAAGSRNMGGAGGGWTDGAKVKGCLDGISGSKSNIAARFIDVATHIFICPANTVITSANRLKDGNIIYRILYIDPPMNMCHHLEVILELLGVVS